MRQLKYLLVVFGLLVPAMAMAHGPTRQKVTLTTEAEVDTLIEAYRTAIQRVR